MPDINVVEQVFFEALAQPEDDRLTFLHRRCENDDALYVEVVSLLKHARRIEPEFLRPPEVTLSPTDFTSILEEANDPLPQYIGTYRVVERVAEGGMGVVYRAEQTEPIERTVAIKVLRPGVNRNRSMARFRLEQQVLGVMQHPGIARIFDAGTTDEGQPYIAMEFIAGESITKFCAQSNLTLYECLELFVQACEAIQHAHQKGIIHRDIKPANVLVTTTEGDAPRIKIIDFSIAKPTQTIPLLAGSTRHGEVLGSLNYMAPEQLNGLTDIDTRVDIFALGALLYEILTGCCAIQRRYFEQGSARDFRESSFPPIAPSARLASQTKLLKGARSTTDRHPHWVARRLRGDLDWIVLKALEFERSNRYGTAAELADDVRRHLNDEPVLAGPPSRLYRLRKFVSRYRTWVVAASIIAVLLVLSLVGVTSQAWQATQARRGELENAYVASIAAANSAIESGDVGNGRRFLEMAPSVHRGWEWQHLWAQLDASDQVLVAPGQVLATSLDRFGRTLAVARPAEIQLFNATSGKQLTRLHELPGLVQTVAMSPEGDMLAAGLFDGTVIVWSHLLTEGEKSHTFKHGHASVFALAFSSDGSRLAAASGQSISVWNPQAGTVMAEWKAKAFGNIEFIPDTQHVAVVLLDSGVAIYDSASGTLVATIPSDPKHEAKCIAMQHDGSLLAIGEREGGVRVWDVGLNREVQKLSGKGEDVLAVAFSGDGRFLIAGGRDPAIHAWEVASWSELQPFVGHSQNITSLAINHDGSRMFSGSVDNTLRIWHDVPKHTQRLGFLAKVDEDIISAGVSTDGLTIAATTPRRVYFWRMDSSLEPLVLLPDERPSAVDKSPRGDCVALALDRKLVFIDDATRSVLRATQVATEAAIRCVQFSPDGFLLAVADGKELLICDVQSGSILRKLASTAPDIHSMRFSPGGDQIAAVSHDGSLYLLDPHGIEECVTLCGKGPRLGAVAFSPSGDVLATGDGERDTVSIWDVNTRSRIGELDVGSGTSSLAFGQSGDRLFVGTKRGEIQLWRVDRRDLVLCLRHHEDWVVSLHPCGDRVISTSRDGSIHAWTTPKLTLQNVASGGK